MRRSPLIFVATATLALALSCSQGEGERCEIDGDCASGLECQRSMQEPPQGRCVKPGTPPPAGMDAAAADKPADVTPSEPAVEKPAEPVVEAPVDAGDDAGSDAADGAGG